jgi:ribosomal protein S17E
LPILTKHGSQLQTKLQKPSKSFPKTCELTQPYQKLQPFVKPSKIVKKKRMDSNFQAPKKNCKPFMNPKQKACKNSIASKCNKLMKASKQMAITRETK